MPAAAEVNVLGIRHHGPGSARALRRELEEYKPDIVLIEGPPEADSILPLAADEGMVPPVALLAYVPPTSAEAKASRKAAFWPFAEFSPEWQAIRHALGTQIPVRFCDLPAAHQLAEPAEEDEPEPARKERAVRLDPLGWLAETAGYDDAERWWDDVVEHRGAGPAPFAAIAEAMGVLREHSPEMPGPAALHEARREAYMRRTLRRALKDGYERVAVVCGAWHVPAISTSCPVGKDDQLLRGLPKAKVELTWVPWTHGRLANESGYGAGVRSPGWYHHLFSVPDRPIERWLTQAARLLREEDLPVSSAHVIEAVRLADTLAALRDRPLAGLDEVTEASRAVLCEGADLPLELIQRRMVVGERLGTVPDTTPVVPLQRDLQAEQRRLKFKPSALDKEQDLDLRKPTDLDRSKLLHRLRLLGVAWGVPSGGEGRSKGTFRETWTLAWRPEFDVELIEASVWGTSVHAAASAKAVTLAKALASGQSQTAGPSSPSSPGGPGGMAGPGGAGGPGGAARAGLGGGGVGGGLPELTSLAERCLLADLGDALPEVMRALGDRAAADTDVAHLMAALPPLVRALRYGDVRGTPTGPLRTVVDGLVTRIGIGLPVAVSGLDDDAAAALLKRIDEVHGALALLADEEHITAWYGTLHGVMDRHGLHGLLEGRLTRLLRDAGRLGDVEARMARAVSVGETPARAAAWIEGFLSGGGLILVHDIELLRLVDGWIAGLPGDAFKDVLPLLRRTFSNFQAPERRSIGSRVKAISSSTAVEHDAEEEQIDEGRAAPAAHTVAAILGWPATETSSVGETR